MRTVLMGLVVAAAGLVSASAQTAVPTVDRRAVLIEYRGPVQISNEFIVLDVRIVNRSGRARSWVFEFNAVDNRNADSGRHSRFELDVEHGADRVFEILVPLTETNGASWVQMRVFGYGIARPGQMEVVANTNRSLVAASEKATLRDASVRTLLAPDPTGSGAQPFAVAAEALPSDWRAYWGLSVLWLAEDEWKELDAPVRSAITEWIASGGRLVLVVPDGATSRAPVESNGLGLVVTVPEGVTHADVSSFRAAMPRPFDTDSAITWVSQHIEPIETHRGLLSFVLVGYLVLVLPVNLAVFAPKAKRVRLFWTMPAIALSASAVIALVIVLQDGIGGVGFRASLVYLQPELNRELVVQEQMSRTGALVTRGFDVEDGAIVKALEATTYSYRGPRLNVVSDGPRYSGDWFRSRSVQAQRLVRVRSSRARIELDDDGSGAPRILSSIDTPLETLFYRDQHDRIWLGENVVPGRPVELRPSSEGVYQEYWHEESWGVAGPEIRARANALRSARGVFLAIAGAGQRAGADRDPERYRLERRPVHLRRAYRACPGDREVAACRWFTWKRSRAASEVSSPSRACRSTSTPGKSWDSSVPTARARPRRCASWRRSTCPTPGASSSGGHDVLNEPEHVRAQIGWMPDSYGAYPHTTVWEYLDFFARAFGLEGRARRDAVDDVMEFTDLGDIREREMDSLSKGMGQRLCLGRALLHDPSVLILDEPAAGLDPKARVEFKRLVRLLARDGKTIFISSHILSELEEMCDAVLFIDQGEIVHHGSAESLMSGDDDTAVFVVNLTSEPERLASWADMTPGVELVELTMKGGRVRLHASEPRAAADALRRMVSEGLPVIEFRREERRLEEAFIETLNKNGRMS